MPYMLSASQLETLVIETALAAGLINNRPENPDAALITSLTADIMAKDVKTLPTDQGAFVPVYGMLDRWISVDDGSGNPGDSPREGVDASAWTFIRAAANVNDGDNLAAYVTREYTRVQHELRIGEPASDALLDQMSNGIAFKHRERYH